MPDTFPSLEVLKGFAKQEEKVLPSLSPDERNAFYASTANMLVNSRYIKKYRNTLHCFFGSIYVPMDEASMCHNIYQLGLEQGRNLNASDCQSILREIIIRLPEFQGMPNGEELTIFGNGYFSNWNGKHVGLPEDYFGTICVNAQYCEYCTSLYHPVTDAFLNTICAGDPELIQRHWEFIGYCLSSDSQGKAIFSLYGPTGNNGKSTELALLKALLSPGSVANMPLHILLTQFGVGQLENIRLEISADEGSINLKPRDISLLKSISGHDDITADVKFKPHTTFRSTCKIIIASNYNIGCSYTQIDQAFLRRLVIIPYPVSIPKEQQDPWILSKLLNERDAIATEAFRAYLNLRQRNYVFSGHERFDQINVIEPSPVSTSYDAIRKFVLQECDLSDPAEFTFTETLFNAFTKKYGPLFVDTASFSQALSRSHPELQSSRKRINGDNKRGFYGIQLFYGPGDEIPESL